MNRKGSRHYRHGRITLRHLPKIVGGSYKMTFDELWHYTLHKGGQTWLLDFALEAGWKPEDILRLRDQESGHNFKWFVAMDDGGGDDGYAQYGEENVRAWFRDHGYRGKL